MDIPESMKSELMDWNDGQGIDLESWIGCSGNFSLAVGYISVFWPEFVEFDGFILRKGFAETSLREWKKQEGCTRKSIEWVMNHLHISDIQFYDCADISKDKIKLLGQVLKETYEAKLKQQFPNQPCIVEFHEPENEEELTEYQISFWQVKHEEKIP